MKKKVISIVMAVLLCSSIAMINAGAEKMQLGDVNNDGKINAIDARKVLRASAQLEELTDAEFDVADVNFDNKVNAIDARILLRVSAQLETLPDIPTTEKDTTQTTETTTVHTHEYSAATCTLPKTCKTSIQYPLQIKS